jgi:flavodoxin I
MSLPPTPLREINAISAVVPQVDAMKALVVYDSVHGNTEQIAKAIASAIQADTEVARTKEVDTKQLAGIDLLVVGSPTYGGRPTESAQSFLNRITGADVNGVRAAAFDTRLGSRFVKLFGFAADKIATALSEKGAIVTGTSEGFIVKGREGPLADGELDRAATWARGLAAQVSATFGKTESDRKES